MKFILATILFTAVLGTPLAARQENDAKPNIDLGPADPPKTDIKKDIIATGETPKAKRSADLVKRAMTVDVYQDQNRGGRHQALVTDLNRCYGLGNGWNDVVSSVAVQRGFTCYFYVDGNCKGRWLQVPGQFTNTAGYGFNDNISSYLCYN